MSLSLKCLSTSDETSAPMAISRAAAFWRPFKLLDPMSWAMVELAFSFKVVDCRDGRFAPHRRCAAPLRGTNANEGRMDRRQRRGAARSTRRTAEGHVVHQFRRSSSIQVWMSWATVAGLDL